MKKGTAAKGSAQETLFGTDVLTEAVRGEVVGVIERILAEEMGARLGAGPYAREEGRRGYRNGSERRTLVTSWGPATIQKPRARIWADEGREEEFRSDLIQRYQRRTRRVDNELLAMYLGGVSTRRVKKLVRLLGLAQKMSTATISRIVQALKEPFETWRDRSLKEEKVALLYLDAIVIKARLAGRVVKRPILVAVGVRETGEKVLLGIWSKTSESTEAWKDVLENLVKRELPRPILLVVDGCPGLRSAIELVWPDVPVQRCAVHKLRNLLRHAPKHAYDEVRDDFHAIVYADNESEAQEAHRRFVGKWSKSCESVAQSLQQAGEELLTFYSYPKSMWKCIRTTNIIERLNEEFRRRVKTQSSLPSENAVLMLMFGLVASGFVQMHKIDGYQQLPKLIKEKRPAA